MTIDYKTKGTCSSRMRIEVEDGVSLSINGADFTPRDVNGREVPVFRYNGTVYAPVSASCAISPATMLTRLTGRNSSISPVLPS